MKRDIAMMAILVSLSSLGLGMVIGLRINASPPVPPATDTSVAVEPSSAPTQQPANPPADQEDFGCVWLPKDYPARIKFNGKRLPLNYADLEKNQEKERLRDAMVKILSHGRRLVTLDDTLYMFDAKWHILWQHKISAFIIDVAVVESTGRIYGTAQDDIFFILDAATGKKLWSESYNGRHEFHQVVPFGPRDCLLIAYEGQYRESLDEWTDIHIPFLELDGLIACRGTKKLWAVDWPPDAELIVKGKDIYAVTKTDRSIYVRKVRIPKLKKH